MSIEVKDITRTFGKQKALDGVSFSVHTGEIAGFIGPNGAGKSTMMKIIMGILPADHGKVRLLDMDVKDDPLSIRKQVGYLPENNPLYPEMYVREYLSMVAGMYRLGKKTASRVKEIVSLTGLEKEQSKKIGALSKGYRQRVGLAQALIHDPPVLILDEPTTGLDPNQIVDIRNLISDMALSKTVMLSTHILQEVEAICNHILIINQGKIVADKNAGNLHDLQEDDSQTILLELGEDMENSIFEGLPGLIRAVPVKNRQWLLSGPSGESFRKDVFQFAVEKKLSVLSFQKQEQSLEEVFRRLTL